MFVFHQKTIRMQTIQGDGFTVSVVKSARRKTTALKIKNGEVSIHIPKRQSLEIARHFVQEKTPWIQQKLQHQAQQALPEKDFVEGESLLFLGKVYSLQLVPVERATTTLKTAQTIEVHGRLNILSKPAIRAALIIWYRQQAELYLRSQTAFLTTTTGLSPRSITIKTYKARWGSCRTNGDIQYNWKLMLAPPEIIDYVIIHELCHLQQHNHSAVFWQLVHRHYPNFKTARLWLKKNGASLEV
jgi:predicted metal-dependent hydrolase